MPPCADHDRRAQHRDRDARLAEQPLDLATRAQVRGEVVVVGAEPAQVDDLPDPGAGGRLPERAGRLGVLALEVRVVERVHQVDRHVDARQRLGQRVRVVHVAADRLAGPVVRLRPAGHRAHGVAALHQIGDQAAADEAGRAGDQHGQGLAHVAHPGRRELPTPAMR